MGKLVGEEIKEDETIVIMYANSNRWAVQFYPRRPDLDIVERLTSNLLLQLKTLKDKIQKEEEDKRRTLYTI